MQKKAQKKKTYNLSIFAVLIILVVLTAFIVYMYTDSDSHSGIDSSLVTGETFSDTVSYNNNAVTPDNVGSKGESNDTVTPENDNKEDEWYLTLLLPTRRAKALKPIMALIISAQTEKIIALLIMTLSLMTAMVTQAFTHIPAELQE